MKKVTTFIGFLGLLSLSAAFTANAAGINCDTLPDWSNAKPHVNLHHVFCGEKNHKGKAVGYHANPNGKTPSTYVKHKSGTAPNPTGLYNWRQIELKFGNTVLTKPLSTFFPNHCSQTEIVKSIQHAYLTGKQQCANPSWAKCGLSAPTGNMQSGYCYGNNKLPFTIATAPVNNDPNKINTGFPIIQP